MPRPRQRRGADAKKEEKRVSQKHSAQVGSACILAHSWACSVPAPQMKREQEEADARAKEAAEKRARHRKSEMPWNALPTAKAEEGAPVDPNALPEVDPDTKAYFQQVAERINELEELGMGSRGSYGRIGEDGEPLDDGEQQEDDRPLLLRGALEALTGHEVTLAGDGETSVILERLLYTMDDFARRVLADRFAGQYDKLVKHRAASHVLQTLFTLAGQTVDREVGTRQRDWL